MSTSQLLDLGVRLSEKGHRLDTEAELTESSVEARPALLGLPLSGHCP